MLDSKIHNHLLELSGHSLASVGFGNLNDVEQETKHLPIMLEVHRPCNEGAMVGGGPSISREMQATRMFLEDLLDAFARASKDGLDVAGGCGTRREA